MSNRHEKATNYGNWVSNRIIAKPAALALIFAASSVLTLVLLVPATILLLIAAYFAYARHLFSPAGGNVQEKVRNIILENLAWDGNGKALDIGCGSAALTRVSRVISGFSVRAFPERAQLTPCVLGTAVP